MPETGHQVVVHHADGLHVGIDDCTAHKSESSFFQVPAEAVGFPGRRFYFPDAFPPVDPGFPVYELPDIFIKTPEFLLNAQETSCIVDGRFDF